MTAFVLKMPSNRAKCLLVLCSEHFPQDCFEVESFIASSFGPNEETVEACCISNVR